MKYPLSELVDRYTILLLKAYRLSNDPIVTNEVVKFRTAIDEFEHPRIHEYIRLLMDVNGAIWDLESDIRKGKEGELGLEEVGKRALKIRKLNNERIKIKNRISKTLGDFEESKIDHASQD